MRLLSRDFTTAEKVILAILAFVLLGLGYYFFVDQPVREQKAQSLNEQAALQTELASVSTRLNNLYVWEKELDHTDKSVDYMPPYNSGNDEVNFLNTVLQNNRMEFTATFGNASRTSNQIRRGFTLKLTSFSTENARNTLYRLTHGRFRCILGNLTYQETLNQDGEAVIIINAVGTFYETMIDGKPDVGLSDTSPGVLKY